MRTTRTKLLFAGVSMSVALLIASCTKTTTPTGGGATTKTSTITGFVERSDDFSRVPNALVFDTRGTAPADTTKSDGSFRLTYQLTDNYSGTLIASRVTFGNDTINFTLAPGANDTLPRNLILKADTNSQKTAASTGIAASIVLVAGGDVSSIAIRGTGFTESTPLTFEVRDSLGVPVSGTSQTRVYFSLLGGPTDGGQYVYPASALTDLTGRATTRITSGTKPGVVQIYAYAKPDSLDANYVVTSSPVRLVISGGLPDAGHFSMSVQKFNIAGMSYDNLRDGISVIVGDKDGNPVQPGTAVYFSTTGGIIQPSATTDKDGGASVSLITANPRPANGRVFVTAKTIGDSGATISHTGMILFTGAPNIIGPASNFQIVDSGSYSFSYMVADSNGNPLSAGNTISVTKDGPGSGDLDLQGDVSVTTTDTQDPTKTNFSVQVQDKTRGGVSGLVKFTISVTGANGTADYSWTGEQLAAGVSPIGTSTGIAAGIQLLGTTATTVSVRGTGASETARLSFQVKDSLGNPITAPNSVPMTFKIQNGPGGGEYLFPASAITDANGQASTTLSSGTKSGVVQIIASTTLTGGGTIQSAPVPMTIASGLADPAHSAIQTDLVNYPFGSSSLGLTLGTVSVQLGDRYGNPAQPSAIYFTTNAGLITASAFSSSSGQAQATLISGPPYPAGGIDTITVITQGENGQNITMRAVVTASLSPEIVAPSSLPNISSGGYGDLYFDVKDANGNPLAAGNAVSVTLTGDGASQLQLSGDNNFQTINTRDTSTVHYHVRLDNAGGAGSGGAFVATIAVSGPNGSKSASVSGFLQAKGVISGGGGGSGYTSSIVLSSVSTSDISVQGTGNAETATLVFQANDSLGSTVDQAHGSMMHFLISSPTLGATLTIDSIQTDASGRATTLVRSGTISGVIQVRASVTVPTGVTITSQPVRLSINSGLPDQAHFTMGAPTYNFPGLDYNFQTLPITVQMGDKYGNPASPTTVYFTTTHGNIQTTGAVSDANGFVTKSLYSGNPRPTGTDSLSEGAGWTKVYAKTFGDGGASVKDSLYVLWTGAPVITKTGGAATYNLAPNASDGPWTFTVTDRLGHPLSKGTTVSVAGSGVTISGQASATLPDALSGGTGITNFSVMIQNTNAGPGLLTAPVSGILMVTVSHPLYGTYTLPLATGVAN